VRWADAVRFAGASLARNRVRSSLILAAVAIGVAGVTVLTWLGDAARAYVAGEFVSLGSHLVIVLPGRAETSGGIPPILGETPRDLTLDDARALRRIPGVTSVAPLVIGSAPVAFGSREREATVLGTTPEFFEVRRMALDAGEALPRDERWLAAPVAVLGSKIAAEVLGPAPAVGEWVRIGDRRFRVSGILAPEGRSLGFDMDDVALVPVASAQALFDAPGLFRVLVEARGRADVPRVEEEVKRVVAERHEGEEDVTVITQDSVLATFDRIFRALTLALGGIAGVSLLVAGILVMNVMVVAVSQRREEIGLLKALGATPAAIRSLFLAEARLLAAAGSVVGLLLGEALTVAGSRLYPALVPGVPAWAAIAAVATAVSTGIAFGIGPARRAARLDPVLALSRR